MLPIDSEDILLATSLSQRLGLALAPSMTDPQSCQDFDLLLIVSGGMLSLQQTRAGFSGKAGQHPGKTGRRSSVAVLPGPVGVDFGSLGMRHRRRSGHNELLGRAVGVSGKRRLRVLDATAGLGRDGFILADMGCELTLCEREPVAAAMLETGLQAAQHSGDEWLQKVTRRISLVMQDARTLTPEQLEHTDVIYLDPMFPQRDKSAAVKKEMAVFQLLLDSAADNETDAGQLLGWAVDQDVARVVVKRPVRAPFLAQLKPSHNVTGKAVRFDVYVRRALK